jgi:O-acetylserine/cysteine efflux transporter
MSFKDISIALLVISLWALNFIVLKKAGEEISLTLFNFMRFLCFIPLLFIFKKPKIAFYKLILTSLFWNVLTLFFMGVGLQQGVSVGIASVVYQTCSFFGVIFCYLLIKEVPKYSQIFGMLISFWGVTLLFKDYFSITNNVSSVIYILAAAVSWGFGNSLFKKYQLSSDVSTTVWLSSIAALPTGIFAYLQQGNLVLEQSVNFLSFSSLMYIMFAAYGATLLAGCCWIKLLKKNPGANVISFMLLLPPISCMLSYLFLNEKYTLLQFTAFLIILFGLSINLNVFKFRFIRSQAQNIWEKLSLTK